MKGLFALLAGCGLLAANAWATSYEWTDNGGSNSWNNSGNWTGGSGVPDATTDDATFTHTRSTGTKVYLTNQAGDQGRNRNLRLLRVTGTSSSDNWRIYAEQGEVASDDVVLTLNEILETDLTGGSSLDVYLALSIANAKTVNYTSSGADIVLHRGLFGSGRLDCFQNDTAGGLVLQRQGNFTGRLSAGNEDVTINHPLALQSARLDLEDSSAQRLTYVQNTVIGALTGRSPLHLPHALVVGSSTRNEESTYTGTISGPGTLIKRGAERLALLNGVGDPSTWTGGLKVEEGTVEVWFPTAIWDGSAVEVDTGAVFEVANTNRDVTIGSLSGDGEARASAATLTVSGPNASDFSGALTGSHDFIKAGSGTFYLSGTSALAVIAQGGTVGGNGGQYGATTVGAGAKMTPGKVPGQFGAPPDALGTLQFASLDLDGTYQFDVNEDVGEQDSVEVTGELDITGATLDVNLIGNHSPPYVIATYGQLTGTFASVTGLPAGYQLVYDYDDGNSTNNIALADFPTVPVTISHPTGSVAGETEAGFTISFSEAVASLDVDDLDVATTGSLTFDAIELTGSDADYTLTFTGLAGGGTLEVALASDYTIDQQPTGLPIDASATPESVTVDAPPQIVSFTQSAPNPVLLSNTISFDIVFSEPVTGITVGQFAVLDAFEYSFTSFNVSGSGSTYTFTIGMEGNGTFSVGLGQQAGVQDAGGHDMVPFTSDLIQLASEPIVRRHVRKGGGNEWPFDRWDNAAPEPYTAYRAAVSGDEIWISAGTYYVDEGPGVTDGNRNAEFRPPSDTATFGGFPPTGSPGIGARNPSAHPTMFSADLAQDDLPGYVNRGENAYGVIFMGQGKENLTFDGLTFTGAVRRAVEGDQQNDNLLFRDCRFVENNIGLFLERNSTATLENCEFADNTSQQNIAPLFIFQSDVTLVNCRFTGNKGRRFGGAINAALDGETLTAINCLFENNECVEDDGTSLGGAIHLGAGPAILINCTFRGNTANNNGGFHTSVNPHIFVYNCVFWENQPSSNDFGNNGTFLHNLIENLNPGGNNLNGTAAAGLAPGFISAGDSRPAPGSVLIDAGRSQSNSEEQDLDGNVRIQGAAIDIGAFESDGTPPTVSLNGMANLVLDFGETWNDPGATATDAEDGNLPVTVGGGSVSSTSPGDYQLTYTATDSYGNQGQATRDVAVRTNYATWALARGLKAANSGLFQNPNLDEFDNIQHFAFDTHPLGNGGWEGKFQVEVREDGGADEFLTLTLPVRNGATFSGTPLSSAPVDGIVYTVHGAVELGGGAVPVIERSATVPTDALPALADYNQLPGADFEYRSFRLSTSETSGFIWVETSEAP